MKLEYGDFMNSLYESEESSCSYYPERNSKVRAFTVPSALDRGILDQVLGFGFRRSGNFYYRTTCRLCNDCLSYKIPLPKFELGSRHKRILKTNSDLSLEFGPPRIDSAKEELYTRYQVSRHAGSYGARKEALVAAMRSQMYEGSENSGELRLLFSEKLLGWILLDLGKKSVSAVYSVFDPDERKRSLGNALVLLSILWAKENGFEDYHLGLYLPGHPKMNYKGDWKPAEILEKKTGIWTEAEEFLRFFQPGEAF